MFRASTSVALRAFLPSRPGSVPRGLLRIAILGLFLGGLGIGLVAAPAGPAGQRFERTVQPGAAGPNRLDPDIPLLAGSGRSLASLRLQDGAGREVPYLLVSPVRREPEWRQGKLLPIAASKTASGFEIDLGALSTIDRVRLDGIPAPFLKRFRLEGGGDRSRWTVLVAQGTLFDLPDQSLRSTEAGFPAGDYRYLRITWDDRNSAVAGLPDAVEARLARVADPLTAVKALVEFTRRASEPGKSRFHLRLPGAGLPVVALELAVGGGNVLRPATVTQGRLGNGEVTPVEVGSGTLRRAVRGELVASDLRLPVSGLEGPELDLVVDDGDNPPLPLTGASVELAPLPWIYFEAVDASPLTARYGDPKAASPRYDLEAVRESLGRVRPSAARWGEARPDEKAAPPAEGAALPTVGAPLEVAGFKDRRTVPAPKASGPPGAGSPAAAGEPSSAASPKGAGPVLTSLLLDAAVLAHSPGLADLRLADGEGHQIPYLVDRRSEPLALPLPSLPAVPRQEGDAPGLSRYRLDLPYATLPEARLVLETSGRVFERQVRLVRMPAERPAGRRTGEEWAETVSEAVWRHADPETPAPRLVLDVPADGAGGMEVRIEDGDNAPLKLGAPQLLLPAVRLRFFHPGGEVKLLYGQPGLNPPRYDLELLGPQLLGAAAEEVALAPEGENGEAAAKARSLGLSRLAFWGVLGLAVLVLLVVLGRLLREKGEG